MKDLGKIIENDSVFSKNERLLLGISGGMDSMVLAHILASKGYRLELAHCNYMLRGEESLHDEMFVKSFAEHHNIPIYILRKSVSGGNVQAKARAIRYQFFNTLDQKHHYDYILTAHHADDRIETFLLQLLRGAQIKAWINMESLRGKIYRPFLELRKTDITKYALANAIPYRQDSSNLQSQYNRNFIRNEILPGLEKNYPKASEAILHAMYRLRIREEHFTKLYARWMSRAVLTKPNELIILKKHINEKSYLLDFLTNQGFHIEQIKRIFASLNKSGAIFEGKTGWHLLVAAHELIVYQKKSSLAPTEAVTIMQGQNVIDDSRFSIRINKLRANTSLAKTGDVLKKVYLDYERVKWPLIVRRWQAGDAIRPLGLKRHRKKVQDILTDAKINRKQKENVWLIEDQSEICWLIGHCQSESFRITSESENMISIEWSPKL